MAGEMKSCQNCQKFLTCEVVRIIQGGKCHPDWIKMGDRIGEICTGFMPPDGARRKNVHSKNG